MTKSDIIVFGNLNHFPLLKQGAPGQSIALAGSYLTDKKEPDKKVLWFLFEANHDKLVSILEKFLHLGLIKPNDNLVVGEQGKKSQVSDFLQGKEGKHDSEFNALLAQRRKEETLEKFNVKQLAAQRAAAQSDPTDPLHSFENPLHPAHLTHHPRDFSFKKYFSRRQQ